MIFSWTLSLFYLFSLPTLLNSPWILSSLYSIFLLGILTYAHCLAYPRVYCVAKKVLLRSEDFRKHQGHLYHWGDYQLCPEVTISAFSFSSFPYSPFPPPPTDKSAWFGVNVLSRLVKRNEKRTESKKKEGKCKTAIAMPQIHWTQFLQFLEAAMFDMWLLVYWELPWTAETENSVEDLFDS